MKLHLKIDVFVKGVRWYESLCFVRLICITSSSLSLFTPFEPHIENPNSNFLQQELEFA